MLLTAGEWLAVIAALALMTAIVAFHRELGIRMNAETAAVLIGAAVLLYGADRRFFSPDGPSRNNMVRYVVAFDAVVFIVVGLAAAVLACDQWQTALLVAGSSLLMGGFLGLLFGYPQGVAQQQQQQGSPPSGSQGGNLVAESAATLGKVIAGFSLAKLSSGLARFNSISGHVGNALGAHDKTHPEVVAGAMIAYFLATGFLSGLFLPAYFMRDWDR